MNKTQEHFNKIAEDYDKWKKKNWYYYSSLKDFYGNVIPVNSNVLEIGCGTGEIINSVKPKTGVGLDISEEMIKAAKKKFPYIEFIACDVEKYASTNKFEYIIMCDLLDHVDDIEGLFKEMDKVAKIGTKIVITTINPIWNRLLRVAEKLRLKMPEGPHRFISISCVADLLEKYFYKMESQDYFLMIPFYIPGISYVFNKYIANIHFLKQYCFIQYIVANKGTGK